MKRHSFLALILCALFLVVGTGCSSQNSGTQNGAAQKTTKSAQLATRKPPGSSSPSRKGST